MTNKTLVRELLEKLGTAEPREDRSDATAEVVTPKPDEARKAFKRLMREARRMQERADNLPAMRRRLERFEPTDRFEELFLEGMWEALRWREKAMKRGETIAVA